MLNENAAFNPVTPYAVSKVQVEKAVSHLADATFSPTFLRNATAYGVSPRLRCDLVVNNLVGYAHTTGEILITSDGSPWRPLVHVEDIARAFLAVLEAPVDLVHNQAFNVGRTDENYRVRDIAALVQDVVPNSRVRYAGGGGPDPRCYRVDCDKLLTTLPAFQPAWTLSRGVEELAVAYRREGLTRDAFLGRRYTRTKQIKYLQDEGRIDQTLRWRRAAPTVLPPVDHALLATPKQTINARHR